MGVKFSQLPNATDVAANDQIAMLDVSGSILTKIPVAHATTATSFGLGTTANYGHVKVSNVYDTVVPGEGIVPTQAALKAVYDQALIGPDIPLSVVDGKLCVTYQTS